MELKSSAFEHEGKIPSKHTCDAENVSPPLEMLEVPKGTKSLTLIMHDPDVPKHLREDGNWDHWVVFNIPPETKQINEGEEPKGVGGNSTYGKPGYGGPCPPDREHRYYFTLYALDIELDLPGGSTRSEIESALEGHVLEKVVLMGKYERVKI